MLWKAWHCKHGYACMEGLRAAGYLGHHRAVVRLCNSQPCQTYPALQIPAHCSISVHARLQQIDPAMPRLARPVSVMCGQNLEDYLTSCRQCELVVLTCADVTGGEGPSCPGGAGESDGRHLALPGYPVACR